MEDKKLNIHKDCLIQKGHHFSNVLVINGIKWCLVCGKKFPEQENLDDEEHCQKDGAARRGNEEAGQRTNPPNE